MRRTLLLGASTLALSLGFSSSGVMAEDVEQSATANISITHVVPGQFTEVHTDFVEPRSNLIDDNAFDASAGIIHAQQINGSGNVTGIAETVGESLNPGNEMFSVLQRENVSIYLDDIKTGQYSASTRSNEIDNAFDSVQGIVDVQQNNGDANAMVIANNILRESDASNGTLSQDNTVYVTVGSGGGISTQNSAGIRTNLIEGEAFDEFKGIATVQQNNGDANSMVAGNDLILDDSGGPISQTTTINSYVYNTDTYDGSGYRTNTLPNVFQSSQGMVDIQQNNGDANSIIDKKKLIIVNDGLVDQNNNVAHSVIVADADTYNATRSNSIDNFLNNASFAGVMGIQQNNGDGNSLTLSKQIAVDFSDSPGVGDADDVSQRVKIEATAQGFFNFPGTGDHDMRDSDLDNRINSSFNDVEGIFNIQQNNGNANSMAIADSLAVNTEEVDENRGSLYQKVKVKGFVPNGFQIKTSGTTKDNLIRDSFKDVAGFFAVQQNNGNANVMGIGTALYVDTGNATGSDGGPDENLGQFIKTEGEIGQGDGVLGSEVRDPRLNHIAENSFRDTDGVANVQQNNGDGNVIGIANGYALNQGTSDVYDSAEYWPGQQAKTSGSVETAEFSIFAVSTTNLIDNNSFNGFSGMANVQQNNANYSVLGIANAINVGEDTGEGNMSGAIYSAAKGYASIGSGVKSKWDGGGGVETLSNRILGNAFMNAEGIATVQQVNGVGHVVGASLAIFADVNTVNGDAPGAEFEGPIVQLAELEATVSGVEPGLGVNGGTGPTSQNLISQSAFKNYKGIARVQQVNGLGNAVLDALTVVAGSRVKDPKPFSAPGLPGLDP